MGRPWQATEGHGLCPTRGPQYENILAAVRVFFECRVDTALEIFALRQQVAVLKRKRPRPPLTALDRLFWTALRKVWTRWTEALVIVRPETVVALG